jgi:SAM-dependent methyltransferase
VLEIGAGDGGNLIPMAYTLPASRFTGIDAARAPVADGRRTIRELGLANIDLLHADLREIGRKHGAFDYVIAHGVYSWIPGEARDALLALCAACLAAGGVASISYNVYPGCYARRMLREMALFHAQGKATVEGARHFLRLLRDAATPPEPWRRLLASEIERMLEGEPATLLHDDLAPVNDPLYFHEFMAGASRHGLQYLGEAHLHEMSDHRGFATALGWDRVSREQYVDFLTLRRFRQTLLCRKGIRLAKQPLVGRLGRLWFSSPAKRDGDSAEGANGVRIRLRDRLVAGIADQLGAAWPRPLSFEELRVRSKSAGEILSSFCMSGFAEPHAWPFPATKEVSDHPVASAVARREARDSLVVTNLLHRSVHLDESIAALLKLLDGSRNGASLTRDWAASPAGPSANSARGNLGPVLEWMARMALLER